MTTAAVPTKNINLHIPRTLYDQMRNVGDISGINMTELIRRALGKTLADYSMTGQLPPPLDKNTNG